MEQMQGSTSQMASRRAVDEIDHARAQEYALLSILLARSPDRQMIGRLALLRGDASPLGIAHTALGEAASRATEESASREYFDLFAGLEAHKHNLPSNLALVTGPSKTGDIELKLTTGVHGPGDVHVLVIE